MSRCFALNFSLDVLARAGAKVAAADKYHSKLSIRHEWCMKMRLAPYPPRRALRPLFELMGHQTVMSSRGDKEGNQVGLLINYV
jgi:hypothetical protein